MNSSRPAGTQVPRNQERFTGWAHDELTAISYWIEIVYRMAAVSHFHAPSSPERRWRTHDGLIFPAPIVLILLIRLRLIRSSRQGFVGRPMCAPPRLQEISIHADANVGHCRIRNVD